MADTLSLAREFLKKNAVRASTTWETYVQAKQKLARMLALLPEAYEKRESDPQALQVAVQRYDDATALVNRYAVDVKQMCKQHGITFDDVIKD